MSAGADADVRHGPSIRRLLGILLAALGVLVTGLFVLTSLQLRQANHQAKAENRRTSSFLVADSMRQSSNDLTLMVRLYVSTGEPRFRTYYNQILGIRAGTSPRPRDYDSSFWDRVLAHGERTVTYGPPESLVAQMRAARFTPDEFTALNAALRSSDRLARLELDVMDRVAPVIAKGVDSAYQATVAPQYRRLVDRTYLAGKAEIMSAVRRFIDLVEQRTLRDVQRAQADSHRLVGWQIGILGLLVLVSAGAMVAANRFALRPLGRLTAATRRIAEGDYAERADVRGVSELERVAGAFNLMMSSVQADVAAREHAEQVAVEAQHTAEAASSAKSSFLAAMSHEIRTPMIGVTGMLEVLAQSELTPEQRHMVATAQDSAAALLQIIGDTLDFSKIEAGKLEIDTTTFALRNVVETAVATFIHTASAKGLTLTVEIDARLAAAHLGDPLRIRQIVSNFLSNAVKFTAAGGITVSARVRDGATVPGEAADGVAGDGAGRGRQPIEIAVTDTGPGLTAEQQQRLFEQFGQAEASTSRNFGGTGLGLVICRRLARLMGGDVTMRSRPGSGTTVALSLSLETGDPAAVVPEPTFLSTRLVARRSTPTREEAIREGSLVLIAEDHSVNRAVLLHQLDTIGLRADAAEDGQEALERYRSGDYAMVVTDVHMPRLDGYGLAIAIRRFEAETGRPRTPIMALTANVTQGEPQRCRDAGMDDFAAKPTTIPLLAAKLRSWLPHVELAGPGGPGPGDGPAEPADPAHPISPTGPVVDPSVLHELTGGDDAMADAILDDFVDSTTTDLIGLEHALSVEDGDEARRLAHRIKGAAGVVGARTVADAAARIERDAADARTDSARLRAGQAQLATAVADVIGQRAQLRAPEPVGDRPRSG
jgi:signal transduction histidine kinase/HPt (histidine-containing phosphotransfer) domain-containing protein/ActR/RegA family two-component response regulator